MEDILDIYSRPYTSNCAVVCMDEKPYQLIDNAVAPIPVRPGDIAKTDYDYIRNGTCSIFVFTEPLANYRHVNVRQQRTKKDWAHEIDYLLNTVYKDKEKVVLVMDNLNTHAISSLYETFKPEKARDMTKRLEIHYTPKHGSWLNIAEIELNVMTRQCLKRRISNITELSTELSSWSRERNSINGTVVWQFTTSTARDKLKSLYPKIEVQEGI